MQEYALVDIMQPSYTPGIMRGTYSEVTEFTIPSSVTRGRQFDIKIKGHLFGTPTWSNFAIGFCYFDGPADSVTVSVEGQEFTIPKNGCLVGYTARLPPSCTTLELPMKCKGLPVDGQYIFLAATGWADTANRRFVIDDVADKTVSVSAALPWQWLAIAIGGVIFLILGITLVRRKVE